MNDRKRRVLLNAQRLFIEKGFTATSIQDILNESHISKGTFYNYFSSKNECLMAILTHAYDVATARRQELMIGKNLSDKEVFVKQIAIRLQVNREHQLIPLFEAIFHSKDPELRDFVIKYHLAELSWLSQRLVDVYGEESAPYALDCAIMMVGMIKHFTNVWVTAIKEEIDTHELIGFILRRTDSIISNMIQTNDKLLGDHIFLPFKDSLIEEKYSKEQMVERLSNFSRMLDGNTKGKQYAEFFTEEIQLENPRLHLLEPVLRAFGEAFTDTPVEAEAKELAFDIYNYLKSLEKQA